MALGWGVANTCVFLFGIGLAELIELGEFN